MKRIFILTGEPSGDKLASTVIKQLKQTNTNIKYLSVGGYYLTSLGIKSIFDIKEITFMGFTSVLLNIFKIKNKINITVDEIIKFNPDILFSVDSPDFTLRVAKKVKKINRNIKTSSSEFYKEAGEGANFYFKMEDAIYSSSAQLHRAMGVLYFENTGDYTINIQSASIGHKDLSLTGNGDNTNGDLYMSNVNNMLMPESTAGSNFGDGRKPNASNSNEPTWKIAIDSDAFGGGPFWNVSQK